METGIFEWIHRDIFNNTSSWSQQKEWKHMLTILPVCIIGAISPFFLIKAIRAESKDGMELYAALTCLSTGACIFLHYILWLAAPGNPTAHSCTWFRICWRLSFFTSLSLPMTPFAESICIPQCGAVIVSAQNQAKIAPGRGAGGFAAEQMLPRAQNTAAGQRAYARCPAVSL